MARFYCFTSSCWSFCQRDHQKRFLAIEFASVSCFQCIHSSFIHHHPDGLRWVIWRLSADGFSGFCEHGECWLIFFFFFSSSENVVNFHQRTWRFPATLWYTSMVLSLTGQVIKIYSSVFVACVSIVCFSKNPGFPTKQYVPCIWTDT